MPHDPLSTVLRLRRHAVEEARRGLATNLASAAAAAEAARIAEQSIEHEAVRASDPDGDDSLVEAFAAWLPGARVQATQARALHERREAEVSRCRAELAACRIALETIESLIAQRNGEAARTTARRMQQSLDEAVRLTAEDQE